MSRFSYNRREITLCDQDCTPLSTDDDLQQIGEYTDEELAEAVATASVTADQAVYMHRQGISWEVRCESLQSGLVTAQTVE